MLCLEVCDSSCLAARCFATGRPVRMDEISGHSLHTREQVENRFIVSATPLKDRQGELIGVLEIYRDVTAEARIQSRYKVLLDNERRRAEILEEQVRARTADLERSLEELRTTRAALIQSEKLSSLGQLIAGIAHEINNPINFIYGNTEFLQDYVAKLLRLIETYSEAHLSADDRIRIDQVRNEIELDFIVKDVAALLKSVRNGAERAAAIVRDLRSFIRSRPDERSRVDLRKCVEQTLGLLTHETKDRIKIKHEGPAALPSIPGNEGQLNQVIMNLLVNAIQATRGEGTITVRYYERDSGVAFDVADTGVGISEENILKVFDPFFTTKPVGQGTGLGLSLSYSIINAHGGTITVKSKLGEGATFTVWLPLAEVVKPGGNDAAEREARDGDDSRGR